MRAFRYALLLAACCLFLTACAPAEPGSPGGSSSQPAAPSSADDGAAFDLSIMQRMAPISQQEAETLLSAPLSTLPLKPDEVCRIRTGAGDLTFFATGYYQLTGRDTFLQYYPAFPLPALLDERPFRYALVNAPGEARGLQLALGEYTGGQNVPMGQSVITDPNAPCDPAAVDSLTVYYYAGSSGEGTLYTDSFLCVRMMRCEDANAVFADPAHKPLTAPMDQYAWFAGDSVSPVDSETLLLHPYLCFAEGDWLVTVSGADEEGQPLFRTMEEAAAFAREQAPAENLFAEF